MPSLRRASLAFVCALAATAAACDQAVIGSPSDAHPDGLGDASAPDLAPPSTCGNGVCDPMETCASCSTDCGLCMGCGDGTCAPMSESCQSCPQDCNVCPSCGDGYCTGAETCTNCAPDCGACIGCGNGKCEAPKEDCFTCAKDCGKCAGCGDGKCLAPETCASCPGDCGVCSVCGNMKCEAPYETCINCPKDCGACDQISCLGMLGCAIPCIDLTTKPPSFRLSCVADCVAQGCPNAQFFFDQVFNCFVGQIGMCGGNIGCLMMNCKAQQAACAASKC